MAFMWWEGGVARGGGGLKESLADFVITGKDCRPEVGGGVMPEVDAERRWGEGKGGKPLKGGGPVFS